MTNRKITHIYKLTQIAYDNEYLAYRTISGNYVEYIVPELEHQDAELTIEQFNSLYLNNSEYKVELMYKAADQ